MKHSDSHQIPSVSIAREAIVEVFSTIPPCLFVFVKDVNLTFLAGRRVHDVPWRQAHDFHHEHPHDERHHQARGQGHPRPLRAAHLQSPTRTPLPSDRRYKKASNRAYLFLLSCSRNSLHVPRLTSISIRCVAFDSDTAADMRFHRCSASRPIVKSSSQSTGRALRTRAT